MRKVLWWLSVLVALVVSVAISHKVSASDWTSAAPRVITSAKQELTSVPLLCAASEEFIQLNFHASPIRACVFGGLDGIRFARYWSDSQGFRHAIAFPRNNVYYEVRQLCEGQEYCLYSQLTDSVVAKQYNGNTGAVIHKNLTKNLKKRLDILTGRIYFSYESTEQPYVIREGAHFPEVHTAGISRNGKWAIVELKWLGFARLNLMTHELRRIVAPGASYGFGMNPTPQLTISDDGSLAVIAGERMGVRVVSIEDSCGDTLREGTNAYLDAGAVACATTSLDMNQLTPGFYMAYSPRFLANNTRIAITGVYPDGYHAVILGHDTHSQESVGYVALGDSFTSGEGEDSDTYYRAGTNIGEHACHLSTRSYPFIVGVEWNVSYQNVACSGARTVDIYSQGPYEGQDNRIKTIHGSSKEALKDEARRTALPGIVPQIEFIELGQPSVVTVGIGGNDAGLMGKLSACITPFKTCDWAKEGEGRLPTKEEIGRISPLLRALYQQVKRASPGSEVIAIGYPSIINASDAARCGVIINTLLNKEERRFIDEATTYINEVIASAAEAGGVRYIDIYDALQGIRLCDENTTGMNGIRLGDDIAPFDTIPAMTMFGAESFHPTPMGHAKIATKIIAARAQGQASRVTPLSSINTYWGSGNAAYKQRVIDPGRAYTSTYSGEKVNLRIANYTFSSGSFVKVMLDTEDNPSYQVAVDSKGGAALEVSIADKVSAGFYTLKVEGRGYVEDTPLVMYQTLQVIEKKARGNGEVVGRGGSEVLTVTIPSAASSKDVLHGERGEALGVKSNHKEQGFDSIKTSTKHKTANTVTSPPSTYVIAIVAAAIGTFAIVLWALYSWRRKEQ